MSSSLLPSSDSPSLSLIRNCPPGGMRPLMAPGGRENYFSPDLQRLLFGADEPLSRFLPPANWQVPDRAERSKSPHVVYTIPDEVIKTARPLTTLPRSEIDAFTAAVGAFLAKASLDAKGVPPFVRQCRAEFRLPNPELDPGAYWVYGPEFDRRLLILWGCEAPASPSLTLEKAVETIGRREMKWQDKQDLALKLARADSKLGRFFAPRSPDGSLNVNGAAVPASKLKRLERILPKEWRAFEEAAKAYYARARPEATDVAPFEKELRRDFRVPGPDAAPEIYYRIGSHFVIATDRWTKESTLPLTNDSALPPSEGGEVGNGQTVSMQLKRREQPAYVRYVKLAAMAAALVLAGSLAWYFRPDHTKPTLARENAAEVRDSNTIVVTFSEPIVLPPAEIEGQSPALSFFASAATIKSAEVHPTSKRKVTIVTEAPLRDGEKYGISITRLTDRAGNVIEPASAEFSYYDARPPELKVDEITADGTNSKRVILPFTKPISEASLNPSYFMIYEVTEGGRRVSLANVLFDPETKNHTAVMLESSDEFTGNKWYRFELGNVTDASARPNRVVEIPEDKRRFQYVDKLPPRIREVVAMGGDAQIELLFSKPIERSLAVDLNNYAVLDPAGAPLTLLPGGIKLNETGERLTLHLQSGRLATGRHTLKVLKLADAKGQNPLARPLERPFQFNDAVNPAAPKPKDRPDADKLIKGATQLDVDFDRGLPRDGKLVPARFRLVDRDRKPLQNEVLAVSQPEDNPSRVSLKLKQPLEPGEYAIETNGLSDVFGTVQQQPAYGKFKVKGFVVLKSTLVDWKQPPMLRGGKDLILAFTERITPESAKALKNYKLQPAIPIAKVLEFKPGTDENPTTVVILQLAQPAKEPVTVTVSGLILVAIPNEGPQTLPPMTAQTGM